MNIDTAHLITSTIFLNKNSLGDYLPRASAYGLWKFHILQLSEHCAESIFKCIDLLLRSDLKKNAIPPIHYWQRPLLLKLWLMST